MGVSDKTWLLVVSVIEGKRKKFQIQMVERLAETFIELESILEE